MMQDRLIKMGTIVAPLGIKGEVKINPLCEPVQFKLYSSFYDENNQALPLKIKRIQKGQVIAQLDTVCDRNKAETMRGTDIFIKHSDLPKLKDDAYYICDLLGLDVFENNQKIGIVSGVENYGASDVMQITLSDKKEKLIAMSKQTIKNVDLENKKIDVFIPDEIDLEDKDAL
ncbi:MAG: ribosome maturation factor RimM [Alphaproteobacteria bacterium]